MNSEPETLDRNRQDNGEAALFHREREALYTLFARCFGLEMDAEAWGALGELPGIAEEYLAFLGGPDSDLLQGVDSLARLMEELSGKGSENLLMELAREYASNFLGVGSDTVPLCESHYRKDNQPDQDSPYFRVKKHYQKAELVKSATFSEPEDHLATELAFMAHLCARSCESVEKGSRELRALLVWQRDFLHGHPLTWLPALNGKVAAMAQGRFYGLIAALVTRFLELENGWLDQSLQNWNYITRTD